ncbi:MAG TPA: GntR family transcriptional regulator [Planctomycetota bacterium]|nr:GntR family transcriptional regulator [Planctomycetota bacterium]
MAGSSTVNGKAVGRSSAEVIASLRSDIESGKYGAGSFLPSVRQLAGDLQLAPETARRALKALESEGLVVARPGSGYQVLPQANDPHAGCPVAFLDWRSKTAASSGDFNEQLLSELKAAAGERDWSLLVLSVGGLSPCETVERLTASRAFGALLSTPDQGLLAAVREARLPAVMLDDWEEDSGTDSVMQDGHQGGVLAAQHLVSIGCRRIAWFGPTDGNSHTLTRLGGFTARLLTLGRELASDRCFSSNPGEDNVARAREMLSGPNRPDGIAALWQGHTVALKRAADELGLVAGRDFQMVGWCPEESYERQYLPLFAGGPVPTAATWSVRTMAVTALARMAERRSNPELPPLSVKVPVRLRMAVD